MTSSPDHPLSALLPMAALVIVAAAIQALILHAMGQPWICTCGVVRLWQGTILSPENSQQVTDWYTPSHVIHGMIFFALGRLAGRRWPIVALLAIAVVLEVGWELAENSPPVIARYREQALAQGYSGDSVLNSVSDMLAMVTGFLLAWRLPVRATVGLAVAAEIITAVMVRDNLTLNIIQLIHPVPAIAAWQAGPR